MSPLWEGGPHTTLVGGGPLDGERLRLPDGAEAVVLAVGQDPRDWYPVRLRDVGRRRPRPELHVYQVKPPTATAVYRGVASLIDWSHDA